MNYLILSGAFGMGHNSAAKAIAEQLQSVENTVTIADICKEMYPVTYPVIYGTFNFIAKKHHIIYNQIYQFTSDHNVPKSTSPMLYKKVEVMMKRYKPDVVISTLPLSSYYVHVFKKRTGSDVPLVTCITDIKAHPEWINAYTDYYLVPTDQCKERLMTQGVEENQISVAGIPIREIFFNMTKKNRLPKKELLIMGGGLGLIPEDPHFFEKVNNLHNVHTTIITGHNKELYNQLHNQYKNITVIGFTDKVADYMSKSDLLLSKAGGITLFESIHSNLPLLVPTPTLSQEMNNAHFIEEHGIGQIVWDKKADLTTIMEDLLCENTTRLNDMKCNMKELSAEYRDTHLSQVLHNVVEDLLVC